DDLSLLAIDDLVLPSHSEPTRWVKLIPIKINVFMWRARRGCLPTRYNLVQKGVILESTSCPVCFSDEEDVHHLLFRCSLSQEVLHRVCRWWEIDFQLWRSFSEWDEWFSSIRLPGSVKGFLEGVFYGTTYVGIVDDVNGLKKKKWATHALDNLVHGINTYKNGIGTIRKNLSGCTIFLLEIPEPKRTKMINKKLDELLKTRNNASILKMSRTRSKPAAETEGLSKYDLLRTTTTTQEEEESLHNVRVKVRGSPKVFVDALEPLEPERRKWLEDTPFHKLLDMDRENNALIKKFVSMFNTEDHSIELEGKGM
ncbi:RNA-directed DNA polymerase, eukaryota, partial [Tanacetum coccineum]